MGSCQVAYLQRKSSLLQCILPSFFADSLGINVFIVVIYLLGNVC